MSFIVRYQSASATEHDLFDSLEDALARVETLHNDPNAAGAMLFKQVPLRVQTVVRVSIDDEDAITLDEPAPDAGAGAPPASSEPPPGAMPLAPVTPVAPVPPAPSDDDTGKRRFSR